MQTSHRIIHVINDNEENVWLGGGPTGGSKAHTKDGGKNSHGGDASSRHACSRTERATIFWTCIKIAKALKDFHGKD